MGVMDYVPFTYGVSGTVLRAASLKDAQVAFANFLNAREGRLVQLARLVGESGLKLDLSNGSIDDIEEWFIENLEALPEEPTRLEPVWNSIAIDIGIYFGEILVHRSPALAWVLWDDPSSPMHQRHVVSFSDALQRNGWGLDVCMLVASYALKFLDSGTREVGFFRRMATQVIGAVRLDP